MATTDFQRALERLVNDKNYRKSVAADGTLLKKDFSLSNDEMKAMTLVGVQSGWIDNGVALDPINCCCCCCPA